MQYLVRALDASQQIQSLLLEAADEADARSQALTQRLAPLSIRPRKGIRREATFPLLLFAQELNGLLAAGLNIVEALDALCEKDAQPGRRAVIARLAQHLRAGERLSTALQQQSSVFPPLFVGLVQAAEGTSDLPRALTRFADYQTKVQAVRHKVMSAAIYPTILLVVGTAVSLFLLGYVVPKFAAVYHDSGRPLPWASALLMRWGTLASDHAAPLLGATAFGVIGAVWALRRKGAAALGWRLMRLLPGAAQKLDLLELSRLYLTLGTLVEGGIPLTRALRLSTAALQPESALALERVREAVQGGESLSDALQRQGLSTPVAARLLRVGEQSGQLGTMLARAAAFHDEETTRWIERFSKAFEPMLMALIGLVIGMIVILLYMPIFDLAGSLQ
jgi:general secretion pathway protein F